MSRTENVIKLFENNNPATKRAIEKLKLKLKPLGVGTFRAVYKIRGTSLVVKIPRDGDGIKHSKAEHDTIKEILNRKKYRKLKQYMPEIHYYNEKTGVIVMPYYRNPKFPYNKLISNILTALFEYIHEYAKSHGVDLHSHNIGMNYHGDPVLLDLGYFSDYGKCLTSGHD